MSHDLHLDPATSENWLPADGTYPDTLHTIDQEDGVCVQRQDEYTSYRGFEPHSALTTDPYDRSLTHPFGTDLSTYPPYYGVQFVSEAASVHQTGENFGYDRAPSGWSEHITPGAHGSHDFELCDRSPFELMDLESEAFHDAYQLGIWADD
jgi:hypothetical protein